jgi:hypothetical protein
MGWSADQLKAARAAGLPVATAIVDSSLRSDDPRGAVYEEKRVWPNELRTWLENLQRIGVERIGKVAIADLLGG